MSDEKSLNKKTAIIVGILILVAYSMLVSVVTDNKWLVALLDFISGLAVIGIAVLMYPFFKVAGKKIPLSYLLLKIIEGTLMIVAGILYLESSSQYYRGWIYDGIHLYTFISSAFIFYYLLYTTKLVPRYISVWGGIATFALFTKTVLSFFGLSFPILDIMLILIITNEIFLAFWLIVKGFNPIK